MKAPILPLLLLAAAAIAQGPTTDPTIAALNTAAAEHAKVADELASVKTANTTLLTANSELVKENADLKARLAAVPPPAPLDPVMSWLKSWIQNGDAVPYTLLRQMAAFPISSYYSPGLATTPAGERYTLVCISNSGLAPVLGVEASAATK
jgi:hypothetical protein